MADNHTTSITVDRWPSEWGESPEKGDLLTVKRTGEVLRVVDVDEEAMTLRVERLSDKPMVQFFEPVELGRHPDCDGTAVFGADRLWHCAKCGATWPDGSVLEIPGLSSAKPEPQGRITNLSEATPEADEG